MYVRKNQLARCFCAFSAAVSVVSASAAPAPSQPDAQQILFANAQTNLSTSDKQTIARELGFRVSKTSFSLEDPQCGPVGLSSQVVDLTGHGSKDVFVMGGNLCTSGDAGTSVWLFVKDAKGHYTRQLGFPAAGISIRKTVHAGYHELAFTVPGQCMPVWQWNGRAFVYSRSETESGQTCKS